MTRSKNSEKDIITDSTDTEIPALPPRDSTSIEETDETFERELEEEDLATLAALTTGLDEGTIEAMVEERSQERDPESGIISLRQTSYGGATTGACSYAAALYCLCMATTCLVAGTVSVQTALTSAYGENAEETALPSTNSTTPSLSNYDLPEEAEIGLGSAGGIMTLMACSYGLASLAAACLTLSACGVGAGSSCVESVHAAQEIYTKQSVFTQYCGLPLRKAGYAALMSAGGLAATGCSLVTLNAVVDAVNTQIAGLVINNVADSVRDLVLDAIDYEVSSSESSPLFSSASDFDAEDPAFLVPSASVVLLAVVGCCIGTAALKSCIASTGACLTGTGAIATSGITEAISHVTREEQRRSEEGSIREHSSDERENVADRIMRSRSGEGVGTPGGLGM